MFTNNKMDSSTTKTSEPLISTTIQNSNGSIVTPMVGLTEEEKIFRDFFTNNDVIDLNELKQLIVHFSLPDGHRCYIWKLLLGILPIYVNTHNYVNEQKTQQFADLTDAVRTMRLSKSMQFKDQVFWSCMSIDNPELMSKPMDDNFSKILKVIYEIIDYDDDTELYWFAVKIWQSFRSQNELRHEIGEKIRKYLIDKQYSRTVDYFDKMNFFEKLPFENWFLNGFSFIIHAPYLCKIWDKLIAGSSTILPFVAIVLITYLNESLINACDLNEAVKIIERIDEKDSEIVVNKALAMWQQCCIDKDIVDTFNL